MIVLADSGFMGWDASVLLHPVYLSAVERGVKTLSFDALVRVAKGVGVRVEGGWRSPESRAPGRGGIGASIPVPFKPRRGGLFIV
jgi:hypothetical protein